MAQFSLGFWAAGGASSSAAAFEQISTTILGSSQASVTFSSIPTTYKHLQIRATFAGNTATERAMRMQFNGDSATNYAYHSLVGTGSVATADVGTTQSQMFVIDMPATGSTNVFGAAIFEILDYANTSKNKTTRVLWGEKATTNRAALSSGLWQSTAVISSITLSTNFDSFAVGSRFSLYGIKG